MKRKTKIIAVAVALLGFGAIMTSAITPTVNAVYAEEISEPVTPDASSEPMAEGITKVEEQVSKVIDTVVLPFVALFGGFTGVGALSSIISAIVNHCNEKKRKIIDKANEVKIQEIVEIVSVLKEIVETEKNAIEQAKPKFNQTLNELGKVEKDLKENVSKTEGLSNIKPILVAIVQVIGILAEGQKELIVNGTAKKIADIAGNIKRL